jgi:cell fate (sporulation/competence/biofilm development) regulator YlbF (YheA/YmcA/DUF963 family)
MPNANLIELETSLKSCVAFCEAQQGKLELAAAYLPRFQKMQRRYDEAMRASDAYHAAWQNEQREQTVARKQLAQLLRDTQQRLHRLGAINFPDTRILYWDYEALLEVVGAMRAYLSEHKDELDFAAETLEKFNRLIATSQAEGQEVNTALKQFQRFVDLRREAINELGALIGEFRVGLRRTLGKKHPDYQSIFWPHAIASDENVLF